MINLELCPPVEHVCDSNATLTSYGNLLQSITDNMIVSGKGIKDFLRTSKCVFDLFQDPFCNYAAVLMNYTV